MKRWSKILFFCILTFAFCVDLNAQCSICTKTAMQMGEKPAEGINSGVIYLMLTPFAVVGYISYRWWKTEKNNQVN
jgi:hypothetical protein